MKDILSEKRHCSACTVSRPAADMIIAWQGGTHVWFCNRCAPAHVPAYAPLLDAAGAQYDRDEAAKAKAQAEAE